MWKVTIEAKEIINSFTNNLEKKVIYTNAQSLTELEEKIIQWYKEREDITWYQILSCEYVEDKSIPIIYI